MIRRAAALLALVYAAPLAAQRPAAPYFLQSPGYKQQDSTPHVIQWYEVAGAAAGIVGLMFVDESVQRWAQDVRSETTDDFAAFFRHFGQPEVWVTVPAALLELSPYLDWATVFAVAAIIYYFTVSVPLATGMIIVMLGMLAVVRWLAGFTTPLWIICIAIFVIAWIGQFIGHALEGKRPSFYKDVQFLMIGPMWLLSHVYRRVGIPF